MNRKQQSLFRWATLSVALAASVHAGATRAEAGPVAFVLTDDNRLLRFDTDAPGAVQAEIEITGLAGGEDVRAIDFRPAAPEQLYGLGSSGRLYRLSTSTGQASAVGASPFAPEGLLDDYGFDINPVTDEVRVVADDGRNRRVNPETGALIADDGELFYAVGDENEGDAPFVVTTAYTNSVLGATETLKYGIDGNFNTLVLLDPPSSGQLATVGSLGLEEEGPEFTGFDIFGPDNRALALSSAEFEGIDIGEPATLFEIDLATGEATALGVFGDGSATIAGFAIEPGGGATPIPLPSALMLFPAVAALAAASHYRLRRRWQGAGGHC